MNNQNIIKYLVSNKSVIGYWWKQHEEQRQQDEEITNLYKKGYFNPNEYNSYMARTLSYSTMMDRFARRMNNMYYYNYVESYYASGYLEVDYWDIYDYIFNGFYYEGSVSYDNYINVLESVLIVINYNILHS